MRHIPYPEGRIRLRAPALPASDQAPFYTADVQNPDRLPEIRNPERRQDNSREYDLWPQIAPRAVLLCVASSHN